MQLSDTALTAQMGVPSLAYAFPHSLEVNWAQYDTVDAVVVAVPLPELESVSELVPLALLSSSESSPESSSLSSPESSPLALESSSEASESLLSSSSESSESPVADIESLLSSSSLSSLSPVTEMLSESSSVESPLSVVAELSVSVWPKTVTMNSSNNSNLIRRNILKEEEVWSS